MGKLDGLLGYPVFDEHGLTHLHFGVKNIPGFRITLDASAVVELRNYLTYLLKSHLISPNAK